MEKGPDWLRDQLYMIYNHILDDRYRDILDDYRNGELSG